MFSLQHFYEKRRKNREPRGFLMLYAILFIAVVLTISLEILSISTKQFIISSTGEESARAFYAADAGTECAYYLDLYQGYFATSTTDGADMGQQSYGNACEGNPITIDPPLAPNATTLVWQGPGLPIGTTFEVKFGSGKDLMCARVYLTKRLYSSGSIRDTTVVSYGYNTDCPGSPSLRLPLIERRIRTVY